MLPEPGPASSTPRSNPDVAMLLLVAALVAAVVAVAALVSSRGHGQGSPYGEPFDAPGVTDGHYTAGTYVVYDITATPDRAVGGVLTGPVGVTQPADVRVVDDKGLVLPTSRPAFTTSIGLSGRIYTQAVLFEVVDDGHYRVQVGGAPARVSVARSPDEGITLRPVRGGLVDLVVAALAGMASLAFGIGYLTVTQAAGRERDAAAHELAATHTWGPPPPSPAGTTGPGPTTPPAPPEPAEAEPPPMWVPPATPPRAPEGWPDAPREPPSTWHSGPPGGGGPARA